MYDKLYGHPIINPESEYQGQGLSYGGNIFCLREVQKRFRCFRLGKQRSPLKNVDIWWNSRGKLIVTGLVRSSETGFSKLHFSEWNWGSRRESSYIHIAHGQAYEIPHLGVLNLALDLDWFQCLPTFFMPLPILNMIVYLLLIGVNVPTWYAWRIQVLSTWVTHSRHRKGHSMLREKLHERQAL